MIFTQLAADPLNGVAGPLNPANWTIPAGQSGLAILNHQCISVGLNSGVEIYTGISWPNDQYAEWKLAALTSDGNASFADLLVRCAVDFSSYYVAAFTNNGDGTVTCTFIDEPGESFFYTTTVPFSIGDVFRLAVLGTTIYVFQNGTQILTGAATSVASGNPAIVLNFGTVTTDSAVTLFAGGSVSNAPASSPIQANFSSENGLTPALIQSPNTTIMGTGRSTRITK